MKKHFLLLILVYCSTTLFAYDVVGHRIIGDVAYRNLSDKAKKNVDQVLGTRGIIYTSSWADDIKSDNRYVYSYAWHYQNLPVNLSNVELQQLIDNPDAKNQHLFYAIKTMKERLLKNKSDAEALKFLVHIVGDMHQPLHLGRAEDLGGNKIEITWHGRKTNIHAVWDGSLINTRKMSSSEYAQYLEDKFAPQKQEMKQYSFFDSVLASYNLSNKIYDYDYSNQNSYHYSYFFMDAQDEMLYRGGLQLANILNEIYK